MSKGINKAIIVGNLGNDPEVKYLPSGGAVTNISVATTDEWKNKDTGAKESRTEWHKIVFFNRLAEIAGEYLKKGSQVYIEGALRTRKWQDKSGEDKYSTEIVGSELQMLGSRGDNDSGGGDYQKPQQSERKDQPKAHNNGQAAPQNFDDFDDDIPF